MINPEISARILEYYEKNGEEDLAAKQRISMNNAAEAASDRYKAGEAREAIRNRHKTMVKVSAVVGAFLAGCSIGFFLFFPNRS
jgi:hypothetical protein